MKKHFILLPLLLFLTVFSVKAQGARDAKKQTSLPAENTTKTDPQHAGKEDTTHTAFNDAKRIIRLLRNPKILTEEKDYTELSKLVLPYMNRSHELITDLLKSDFSPEIRRVVTRYLTNVDTAKIGDFVISKWKDNLTTFTIRAVTVAQYESLLSAYKAQKIARDRLLNDQSFNAIKDRYPKPREALMELKVQIEAISTSTVPGGAVDSLAPAYPDTAKTNLREKMVSDTVRLWQYLKSYKEIEDLHKNISDLGHRIFAVYSANPLYFQSYFTTEKQSPSTLRGTDIQLAGISATNTVVYVDNEKSSLTSFNIPGQSELIDAVAIYMVKRFKQDAVLTFVDALRKIGAKQPLLLDMFPETLKLLAEYPSFEVPRFGKVWTHAIAEDLVQLPENVLDGDFMKNKSYVTSTPEFVLFRDVIAIAKQVRMKVSFPDMVSYFAGNTNELKNKYLNATFQTLQMVNEEFRSTSNRERYWIDWNSELNNMTTEEQDLCFALLKNHYPEIFKRFNKPFKYNSPDNKNIRNYIAKILIVLNGFQTSQLEFVKRIENLKNTDKEAIYTGISFWDLQEQLFTIIQDPAIVSSITDNDMKRFIEIGAKCLSVYREAENKNYSAMVHDAIDVINELVPKTEVYTTLLAKNWRLDQARFSTVAPVILGKFAKIDSILASKKPNEGRSVSDARITELKKLAAGLLPVGDLKAQVQNEPKSITADDLKAIKKILVYDNSGELSGLLEQMYKAMGPTSTIKMQPGTGQMYIVSKFAEFFTDMLSAKDNKDMVAIVGTYAAPPNSYKIKRATRSSISINSYIGAYMGSEVSNRKYKAVYGISAPIGLTFSWGLNKTVNDINKTSYIGTNGKKKALRNSSMSLNLTLVDIGAVISYRMGRNNQTDSIAPLPEKIRLSQFVSPGVSASYGFRNIPLCFTIGSQYTPELRDFSSKPGQPFSAVKIYAGLFYDLPFINISKR